MSEHIKTYQKHNNACEKRSDFETITASSLQCPGRLSKCSRLSASTRSKKEPPIVQTRRSRLLGSRASWDRNGQLSAKNFSLEMSTTQAVGQASKSWTTALARARVLARLLAVSRQCTQDLPSTETTF
jgi:hypothetical protein